MASPGVSRERPPVDTGGTVLTAHRTDPQRLQAGDTAPRRGIATRVSWWPVLLISAAVFTVLVAMSPWYGYYRDELYFRLLAGHPAWGYVDQPPLTPMLAKAGIWMFGDTVTALRVPAALCTAATVVLTAMVAAELGGRTRAQVFTALATATGLYPLLVGHTLLTSSADLVAWTALWLLAARALLRREPRWWLAAGAVFGLALYNKYLVLLLGIGVPLGLLVLGPRRVLAGRRLWAAVGIAALLAVPNLVYQAVHGWPQLTMAAALAAEGGVDNRLVTLPGQLVLIGLPLVPVWLCGLAGLLRSPRWRPVRALAAAHLIVVALVLLADGRMDYAAASLLPLLAAGCVRLERWTARPSCRNLMAAGVALNAALSALLVLPVLPASVMARTPVPLVNPEARDGVGWASLVERVAAMQRQLPPGERLHEVLLAADYGEAGALDRFGGRYGLPPVYSGHNELARWRPPPAARNVIAVGIPPSLLAGAFRRCSVRGWVEVGLQGHTSPGHGKPVTACVDRQVPWRALWPTLVHYG